MLQYKAQTVKMYTIAQCTTHQTLINLLLHFNFCWVSDTQALSKLWEQGHTSIHLPSLLPLYLVSQSSNVCFSFLNPPTLPLHYPFTFHLFLIISYFSLLANQQTDTGLNITILVEVTNTSCDLIIIVWRLESLSSETNGNTVFSPWIIFIIACRIYILAFAHYMQNRWLPGCRIRKKTVFLGWFSWYANNKQVSRVKWQGGYLDVYFRINYFR